MIIIIMLIWIKGSFIKLLHSFPVSKNVSCFLLRTQKFRQITDIVKQSSVIIWFSLIISFIDVLCLVEIFKGFIKFALMTIDISNAIYNPSIFNWFWCIITVDIQCFMIVFESLIKFVSQFIYISNTIKTFSTVKWFISFHFFIYI